MRALEDEPTNCVAAPGGLQTLNQHGPGRPPPAYVGDMMGDMVDFEELKTNDRKGHSVLQRPTTPALPLPQGQRTSLQARTRPRTIKQLARTLRGRYNRTDEDGTRQEEMFVPRFSQQSVNEEEESKEPSALVSAHTFANQVVQQSELVSQKLLAAAGMDVGNTPRSSWQSASPASPTTDVTSWNPLLPSPSVSPGGRRDKAAVAEMESAESSAGVRQLLDQITVVNAQSQIAQYGAILKPVMEGMSRTMLHLMAADATAGSIEKAGKIKETNDIEISNFIRTLQQRRLEREVRADDAGRPGQAASDSAGELDDTNDHDSASDIAPTSVGGSVGSFADKFQPPRTANTAQGIVTTISGTKKKDAHATFWNHHQQRLQTNKTTGEIERVHKPRLLDSIKDSPSRLGSRTPNLATSALLDERTVKPNLLETAAVRVDLPMGSSVGGKLLSLWHDAPAASLVHKTGRLLEQLERGSA
jgi:hypothetical protein